MSELIYLDNAATTKVAPEVYEAMNPYFEEYYGNAASVYRFAGESKKAVEDARKEVADFLGAKPNEIYFTGGGSESDNWALKGIACMQDCMMFDGRRDDMFSFLSLGKCDSFQSPVI